MKKQIIIFFLFLIHFSSWSQKVIKTDIPCNDEVLFKTPGRWLTAYGGLLDNGSEYLGLNKAEKKEGLNRMDAVHQLLLKIYPQPMGIDAEWHHTIGSASFAEQIKYERNSDGILDWKAIKEKHVASFGFVSAFFRYYCNSNNAHEIWPGSPGETGTWIWVTSNAAINPAYGDHGITIGGYPVCMRQPLIKKLGDFELLGIDEPTLRISTGGITRSVIIHRKGMSPYIPVTRRQYLEKCIPYVNDWWNNGIKSLEEIPMRSIEEHEAEKKTNDRQNE